MSSTLQQPPMPLVRVPGTPGHIAPLGVTIHVLIRAADTGGGWALVDYAMPARFPGAAAHVHDIATESFYGLEGETMLEVDGREICLRAGEVAVVPPGVVHRFWNATDRPARYLVLLTPGGFERFYDELAEAAAAAGAWPPADPAVMQALLGRHDVRSPA